MSDPHIYDATTEVRRTREITFQQFDNELLAVDAQAGLCFSLNESAGRIWQMIATPTSFDDLCTRLRAEYNVDEETCLLEVSALLRELNHAGLVTIGDNAAP